MRNDYNKQILDNNIEKFNLMIKNNINILFSAKALTNANKNTIL